MMTKNLAAITFLALTLGVLSASAPAAEIPPINLSDADQQTDPLPPAAVQQITARVKACLSGVAGAKDFNEARRIAAAIVDQGYHRYDTASYRAGYAKVVAQLATGTLAKLDETHATALSATLADINDPAMQPCFEAMVVHPSAAARFFGWKSLASGAIRAKLMAGGKDPIVKMLDLLGKQLDGESSVVIGPMMEMLRLPPVTGGAAPAGLAPRRNKPGQFSRRHGRTCRSACSNAIRRWRGPAGRPSRPWTPSPRPWPQKRRIRPRTPGQPPVLLRAGLRRLQGGGVDRGHQQADSCWTRRRHWAT